MAYILAPANTDTSNMRETFAINQPRYKHKVNYVDQSAILVDGKYTQEIGGQKKRDGRFKVSKMCISQLMISSLVPGTKLRSGCLNYFVSVSPHTENPIRQQPASGISREYPLPKRTFLAVNRRGARSGRRYCLFGKGVYKTSFGGLGSGLL